MQYPEQRKDHYIKYIKKTERTRLDTLITEALREVVTGKRRSQKEKKVKGGGTFQQRRCYVQRLGGRGRRPCGWKAEGRREGEGLGEVGKG